MPTKEQCGHSSDCKMEGCESVPICQLTANIRESVNDLISVRQIQVLLDAVQQVQRDWAPETKKKRICDPYTIMTAALKKFDEYEELRK